MIRRCVVLSNDSEVLTGPLIELLLKQHERVVKLQLAMQLRSYLRSVENELHLDFTLTDKLIEDIEKILEV